MQVPLAGAPRAGLREHESQGLGIWGLGAGVWGLGFGVWDLGFGFRGLGDLGFGCRV